MISKTRYKFTKQKVPACLEIVMYRINSFKFPNQKKFYLCIICLNQHKPNIHLVQSFCSSFYAMLIKTIKCTATFKDSAIENKKKRKIS